MQDIIATIRAAHRERCFAMEQRKRADLSLLSFLRTQAGWRKCEKTDAKQLAINKAAAERATAFADGGEDEGLAQWGSVVDASVGARAPFDAVEKAALKRMEQAAEQLPVWESFGEPIRGFGRASLAVIVGEAGDLSIYSNPAKLWKRMGLAVMDGVRQGGLAKNASKEDWIAHGYNRQRRSRVWNIGDALIKSNKDGEYRTLYLQRKEYELARDPEMQPIKAHRRAQRYMEKRLLLRLWQAWRQTSHSDQHAENGLAPEAEMHAAAAGHSRNATQKVDAGRFSFNSELLDDLDEGLKALQKPRKRRTRIEVTPNVQSSGAPFRETDADAQPKVSLSPKRRSSVLTSPHQGLSGASIQQAAGQSTPSEAVPAAAR